MTQTGSRLIALLLNLGLPGLGHVFVREYLFGVFVFLIMIIAAILFFVSFFLSLSFWPKAVLMVLPLVFYLFTFVDLYRVSKARIATVKRSTRSAAVFLVLAVLFQTLVPIAPLNFGIRNAPDVFTLDDNSLSPVYREGSLLKASRLEYSVSIFFLKKPVFHKLPGRFDLVRFTDSAGTLRNGIVLGLPGETVQMVDGVLVIDDSPIFSEPPYGLTLLGDCPLTYVESYSILVATLHLGTLDTAYMVSLTDVVGQIGKLL